MIILWTKKYRIKNKQVFSKHTTVLNNEVRSLIKHTQYLAQCLGNRKTLIGYGSSEAKDEFKLVDKNFTISTSQLNNKANLGPGFYSMSLTIFYYVFVYPKLNKNKNN